MKILPQDMMAQIAKYPAASSTGVADSEKTATFQSFLTEALQQVNELQFNADAAATLLATGGDIDFHQVAVAAEKANLSLQLTVQIRNRIIEAYQEIMRMQI